MNPSLIKLVLVFLHITTMANCVEISCWSPFSFPDYHKAVVRDNIKVNRCVIITKSVFLASFIPLGSKIAFCPSHMLDTPKNRRLIDLSTDDSLHLIAHEAYLTAEAIYSYWCKTLTVTREFDRTYICRVANDSSRPERSPGFTCTCSMNLIEYDMSKKDDNTGLNCYPSTSDGVVNDFKLNCTPAASLQEMNCQKSNKNNPQTTILTDNSNLNEAQLKMAFNSLRFVDDAQAAQIFEEFRRKSDNALCRKEQDNLAIQSKKKQSIVYLIEIEYTSSNHLYYYVGRGTESTPLEHFKDAYVLQQLLEFSEDNVRYTQDGKKYLRLINAIYDDSTSKRVKVFAVLHQLTECESVLAEGLLIDFFNNKELDMQIGKGLMNSRLEQHCQKVLDEQKCNSSRQHYASKIDGARRRLESVQTMDSEHMEFLFASRLESMLEQLASDGLYDKENKVVFNNPLSEGEIASSLYRRRFAQSWNARNRWIFWKLTDLLKTKLLGLGIDLYYPTLGTHVRCIRIYNRYKDSQTAELVSESFANFYGRHKKDNNIDQIVARRPTVISDSIEARIKSEFDRIPNLDYLDEFAFYYIMSLYCDKLHGHVFSSDSNSYFYQESIAHHIFRLDNKYGFGISIRHWAKRAFKDGFEQGGNFYAIKDYFSVFKDDSRLKEKMCALNAGKLTQNDIDDKIQYWKALIGKNTLFKEINTAYEREREEGQSSLLDEIRNYVHIEPVLQVDTLNARDHFIDLSASDEAADYDINDLAKYLVTRYEVEIGAYGVLLANIMADLESKFDGLDQSNGFGDRHNKVGLLMHLLFVGITVERVGNMQVTKYTNLKQRGEVVPAAGVQDARWDFNKVAMIEYIRNTYEAINYDEIKDTSSKIRALWETPVENIKADLTPHFKTEQDEAYNKPKNNTVGTLVRNAFHGITLEKRNAQTNRPGFYRNVRRQRPGRL